MNVFSRFEYQMFYILYPLVTYSLTLPRISEWSCTSALKNSVPNSIEFSVRFWNADFLLLDEAQRVG
jgi:hypothetical protein